MCLGREKRREVDIGKARTFQFPARAIARSIRMLRIRYDRRQVPPLCEAKMRPHFKVLSLLFAFKSSGRIQCGATLSPRERNG